MSELTHQTLTQILEHILSVINEYENVAKIEHDECSNVVDVWLINQSKNFCKYLNFLIQKISVDDGFAQMYLGQVRTIAEIFLNILYILSLDKKHAAQLLICEDLIEIKKAFRKDPSEFTKSFNDCLSYPEGLFDEFSTFPKLPEEFSKSKLQTISKNSGRNLMFPASFEEKLEKCAPFIKMKTKQVTLEIKKDFITYAISDTWSDFSRYVHGNHLTVFQHGNEAFWIASKTVLMSLAFYELSENVFMQREKGKDFLFVLEQTKKCLSEMTNQAH